jgi:predicted RNA-binding protein Jag
VHLSVGAERAGRIIGKRGATLRAIRFFLRSALEKYGDPELDVDVEDPRPREERPEAERREPRGDRGDRGDRDRGGRGRDRGGRGRDRGGRDRDRDRDRGPAPDREKGEHPPDKLRALARRAAEKARETGKTITINLELNSYDRRIIHLEISDIDGVKSQSEERDGKKFIQVIPE